MPPKPEERWKYIKELENRQIGVPVPKEPSAGGEVHSQTQLTDEQRQLLEQMQADMRQAPTQLNEVPWNEQTPVQRQQTLQRQQQQQMQQQRAQQQLELQQQQQMQQQRVLQQQQRAQQQQLQQQRAQQQYNPPAQTQHMLPQNAPKTQDNNRVKQQETAKAKAVEKRSLSAGWCNAAPLKAAIRRNRCARSWRLKALKAASPAVAAGTAWLSVRTTAAPAPTAH